jgi:glucose-6-phosphate 1-dehydrogenase
MTAPVGDVLVLFGITGDLSRKMILPRCTDWPSDVSSRRR